MLNLKILQLVKERADQMFIMKEASIYTFESN
jgi:hypothetical protein